MVDIPDPNVAYWAQPIDSTVVTLPVGTEGKLEHGFRATFDEFNGIFFVLLRSKDDLKAFQRWEHLGAPGVQVRFQISWHFKPKDPYYPTNPDSRFIVVHD